jgi:FAD:protein FMN transferase
MKCYTPEKASYMYGRVSTSKSRSERTCYEVKCGYGMMGTLVTITVEHPDVAEAKRVINEAFREIRSIETLESIYQEGSDVSLLNKNGFCRDAHTETLEIVRGARRGFEVSEGSWDITVLPLLRLWSDLAYREKPPTDAEIGDALSRVDYGKIIMKGSDIGFEKAGMGLTLSSIAKGYAIDRAIAMLSSHGIEHALVNAGGDTMALGRKAHDQSWRVGVRNPMNARRFLAVVNLDGQAIATSGTDRRYFNDIIDARTGVPAREIVSSSVIADKAIDADALSTCLFVLGAKRGIEVMEDLGIGAAVVTRSGEVLKSAHWRQE